MSGMDNTEVFEYMEYNVRYVGEYTFIDRFDTVKDFMDTNTFIKNEKDVKLLNQALKNAEEHELLTEFVWSLVTHETYPNDPFEMAIDVALVIGI